MLVGTIFENTKSRYRVVPRHPPDDDLKKGISALRFIALSAGVYRTAWTMCHRIRAGLMDENFR